MQTILLLIISFSKIKINNKLYLGSELLMIRKLLVLLFYNVLISGLGAQQPTQYTMYMFNPLQYNPAVAGINDKINVIGVIRQQWVGFEGNPSSQNLSVDLPINYLNSGIGLQLDNDQLGAGSYLQVGASYAQRINIKDDQFVSVGIMAKFSQMKIDGAKLRTPEGNYTNAILDHQDSYLTGSVMSGSALTNNIGIYYENRNINLGLGIVNILPKKIPLGNNNYSLKSNYFFNLATNFQINRIKLTPSLLYKTDLIQHQLDLSLISEWFNKYFIGFSNRGFNKNTFESVAILAGINLNEKLKFCYSFDIGISKLKSFNNGSHEIIVKYTLQNNFGKGVLPKIIYNPRFL